MQKLSYYICLAVLYSFSGCQNSSETNNPANEIAIVEEAANSVSFGSRSHDSVEDLYDEILKRDKNLVDLESTTDKLLDENRDTEKIFEKYNFKSENYYLAAQKHVDAIKDSLVRQKYENLILKSSMTYKHKIKDLTDIIDSNQLKVLSINDLRIILKLTTTLAAIEQYQDKAKPDKKIFDSLNKKLSIKEAEIQQKILK